MKVLHVYKDYFPVLGGIESHVRTLCGELQQRGVEVEVLATGPGHRTVHSVVDGVPVTLAARLAMVASNPISWSIVSEMTRTEADIIHLHFPHPTGELAYLLAGRDRKMVVTYHSDVVKQKALLALYRPFLWKVLARADRILATSPQYAYSSPYLRRFSDKVSVVPLGIDVARFEKVEQADVDAIRGRYGAPIVLFVGLLRYYKGLPYLIRAMKNVSATLLVVGTGPLERALKGFARDEGLGESVVFVGEVSDDQLPAYYHACDVYVLPASHRSEAWGIAQIEAMACGKPAVCTELGTGTTYVNIHGETGLVVPPADVPALAGALRLLLADDSLRRRLGEGARDRVRRELTKELMADRVLAIYRQILGAASGRPV